jgi:hypothetical protein
MEKACKQENEEQKRKELILRTYIQRRSDYEKEKLIKCDYQIRITKKYLQETEKQRRDNRKTEKKLLQDRRTNKKCLEERKNKQRKLRQTQLDVRRQMIPAQTRRGSCLKRIFHLSKFL